MSEIKQFLQEKVDGIEEDELGPFYGLLKDALDELDNEVWESMQESLDEHGDATLRRTKDAYELTIFADEDDEGEVYTSASVKRFDGNW